MAKTSTLYYLVDDINLPSDMILSQFNEPKLEDEHLLALLDILEIDPGTELVERTLDECNKR